MPGPRHSVYGLIGLGYLDTRQAWMLRHKKLVAIAGTIVTSLLSQQERAQLYAEWVVENDRIIEVLGAATPAESNSWCLGAATTFTQPEMNFINNQRLVQTLTAFRAP